MAHATAQCFGFLPPWGLGEGPKGQISLISITVNFKDFLTKLRYKTYLMGFSFNFLSHALGWDLGGGGDQIFVFPKFNQIGYVSYLHEWHMHRHDFLGPRLLGPWGGAKMSNIIKSQLQSQFKDF